MNISLKKLSNGFAMPEFGIGTWSIGGKDFRNENNDTKDLEALKAVFDEGITHVDTAEFYGAGHAEELVGKAIKNRDRSNLFLVSKVSGDRASYDDIISACRASLSRLGISYLDLYLCHWFPERTPLKEFIRALATVKDEGFVKDIGVSNFTPEHLTEAQSYTKHKIVCNQVHYNLMFREPEKKGLGEYCEKNDVILVAYRPIERGKLTHNAPPLLREMCEKYSKTPAQIAINWLVSQKNVVAIAKSSSLDHLHENLGAEGWHMNAVDIEKLRKEFPGRIGISNVMPLE